MIVYASFTGDTAEIATILAKSLKELGIEVLIKECTQVYAKEFLNYDICVVATYTYGSAGNLPEEIEDFYFDLAELDLSEKIYGVLGSGDTLYDYYCKAVDDFDQQFKLTKATCGSDVVKIQLAAEKEDIKNIETFAQNIVNAYHENQ